MIEQVLFWVCMLVALLFGVIQGERSPVVAALWIALALVGWNVFGPAVE